MTFSHARRPRRSAGFPVCAAILLVTCLVSSVRAGSLDLEPVLPEAPFARKFSTDERQPVRAFATAAGVYELDVKKKAVRVWPRSARGRELNVDAPFSGVDSQGAGSPFSGSVCSMAKKPGANVIAVVDACPTIAGLGQYSRISFYSFSETLSGGVLSSVSFTFIGEIVNPALAHASDVSFFPSGDKVAVSISQYSSSSTASDSGAVQFYAVPASAAAPVTDAETAFLLVRIKTVYEGSASGIGAEPFNVPATGVCVDPDGERVYVASSGLNAVLRYDPVSAGVYDQDVTVRTWEYNLLEGNRYVEDTFSAATADFIQGAVGCTNLFDVPPGFNPGDLGLAGSTNNLISSPGSVQVWASQGGNLLVVAERENRRVSAFDEAGNARFLFDASSREDTKFVNPQGAWVSEDGTELVVADTGNGRVLIFTMSEDAFVPDESFEVAGLPEFYFESDTEPHTNHVVVAEASLTNRTYAVTVTGPARAEPAEVTVPAGALSAPFALFAFDGGENGTVCTLDVSGWTGSFIISNVAPSVRTGPLTDAEVDNQSYLKMKESPVNSAMSSFSYGVLEEGSEGIHFHAKAFDVAADSNLTYEWRIVGTTNTLMNLARTSLSNVVDDAAVPPILPNPVYRTTPYYYYQYAEGIPPTVKTRTFTEDMVADFPTDEAGNKLYVEDRSDPRFPSESRVVTNVLTYAESTTTLEDFRLWPAFLINDPQGAAFIVSDTTVTGPDALFPASSAEDGVLYFAVLTVTDKDGGVWNSLDSSDACFFAFATGPAPQTPPAEPAVYSAVFTAVSGTNVAFRVRLVSGVPADTDRADLQYATSLATSVNDWTTLFVFNPGRMSAVVDDAITLLTGEGAFLTVGTDANGTDMLFVYQNEPADDARFYRIFTP